MTTDKKTAATPQHDPNSVEGRLVASLLKTYGGKDVAKLAGFKLTEGTEPLRQEHEKRDAALADAKTVNTKVIAGITFKSAGAL